MKVLFDTSVLVPALVDNHQNHSVCFPWLKLAEAKQIEGIISTHSLAEVYAVLTRLPIQPRIPPSQANSLIVDLTQYLQIIPLIPEDYLIVVKQMASLNLTGGSIFDALIAQAALKAKVDKLLTLNPAHFKRLGEPLSTLVEVPREVGE